MEGEGKVVCVTGASGYVASWVVKLLLSRGYTVRATVRDPSDWKKTDHLLELYDAKERLKLFKADLLNEGSFDTAIEGCDGVFHTASPVIMSVRNPQAELIDPAVKGTINVLNSCTKASSVKRVVVTSSMAVVLNRESEVRPDDVVEESYFSDPIACERQKKWYSLSKTLAEEAAWKFAKEKRMDMITINPGLVIGPLLQPTLNSSIEVIIDLLKGKNPYNTNMYRFVDVRDVAAAHVKAFEIPSANGRYIVDGSIPRTLNELQKVFREFYPDLCLAYVNAEEKQLYTMEFKLCLDKVKSLGVEFTPIDVSLRHTLVSLKEKSFI